LIAWWPGQSQKNRTADAIHLENYQQKFSFPYAIESEIEMEFRVSLLYQTIFEGAVMTFHANLISGFSVDGELFFSHHVTSLFLTTFNFNW
jgi:hypothetical protein